MDERTDLTLDDKKKILQDSYSTLLGICDDIRLINQNPYAPAKVKTQVNLIIRQALKVSWVEISDDVFWRINTMLNDDYFSRFDNKQLVKWIKELKEETATPEED